MTFCQKWAFRCYTSLSAWIVLFIIIFCKYTGAKTRRVIQEQKTKNQRCSHIIYEEKTTMSSFFFNLMKLVLSSGVYLGYQMSNPSDILISFRSFILIYDIFISMSSTFCHFTKVFGTLQRVNTLFLRLVVSLVPRFQKKDCPSGRFPDVVNL